MSRKPEDLVSLRDEKNLIGYEITHYMVSGTKSAVKRNGFVFGVASHAWGRNRFIMYKIIVAVFRLSGSAAACHLAERTDGVLCVGSQWTLR